VRAFEIFLVERLELYKWNSGQETDPIQVSEPTWGQIRPAMVQKSNPMKGKEVVQTLRIEIESEERGFRACSQVL
jgi:hypothetical protein